MAINTRAKRQAAHRAANPFGAILPNPDGTVADVDRAHLLAVFWHGAAYVVLFPPHIATASPRTWRATAEPQTWRADG